jgi:hypothetical protein
MRVGEMAGDLVVRETEAFGPAAVDGWSGGVFLVDSRWVDDLRFRALYQELPERRINPRRNHPGRRWRDGLSAKPDLMPQRNGTRRLFARRLRDRLTPDELFALSRGIEHTVAAPEYRDE